MKLIDKLYGADCEAARLRTEAEQVRVRAEELSKKLNEAEAREARFSDRLDERQQETEKLGAGVREIRAEVDEANARRRTESEQGRMREAELSERLNEARERDAKVSVEIARLHVDKAVLQRELIQQTSAGSAGRTRGSAADVVKHELLDGLGWAFRHD